MSEDNLYSIKLNHTESNHVIAGLRMIQLLWSMGPHSLITPESLWWFNNLAGDDGQTLSPEDLELLITEINRGERDVFE